MSLRSALRGVAESVLVRLPRTTRPGDRLILAYHNVVPNDWTPRGDLSLHMPLHKFEAQLRMIRNEAEIVPLMELLTTDAPGDRRVAITFDDAYASALALGVAKCTAIGAPCTVFIAPGLLGSVPPWDRRADDGMWTDADRADFLWKQHGRDPSGSLESQGRDDVLRIAPNEELAHCVLINGKGVTFGSHSMTHANLASLSDTEVERELERADAWLCEQSLMHRVPVVAYPYGLSPASPELVIPSKAASWGLLVSGGWFGSQQIVAPHASPRWNVPAGISERGFRLRLRGWLL